MSKTYSPCLSHFFIVSISHDLQLPSDLGDLVSYKTKLKLGLLYNLNDYNDC